MAHSVTCHTAAADKQRCGCDRGPQASAGVTKVHMQLRAVREAQVQLRAVNEIPHVTMTEALMELCSCCPA